LPLLRCETVAIAEIAKFIATSSHKNIPEPGNVSSPINPTKARIVPKITKYIMKIRAALLLFDFEVAETPGFAE